MSRIALVACVRNEADIIEAWVRHNLKYVDQALILDHGSCDGTREILIRLQEEGFDLQIVEETRLGNWQTEFTQRLIRQAAALPGVDWVFPLDADEFIHAPSDWRSRLPSHPGELTVEWSVKHYVTQPSDDATELNPVKRIRHQVNAEPPLELPKMLVPAVLARREEGWIDQGNHRYRLKGEVVPWVCLEGGYLAHFSIRFPEHRAAKTVQAVINSRIGQTSRGESLDYYHAIYQELKDEATRRLGESPLLPAYFEARSQAVVLDPFSYEGGALRWTKPRQHRDWFFRVVLTLLEQLANEVRVSTPVASWEHVPPAGVLKWSWNQETSVQIQTPLGNQAQPQNLLVEFYPPAVFNPDTAIRAVWDGASGALTLLGARIFSKAFPEGVQALSVSELGRRVRVLRGGLKWETPDAVWLLRGIDPLHWELAGFGAMAGKVTRLEFLVRVELDPGRIGSLLLTRPVLNQWFPLQQFSGKMEKSQRERGTLASELQARDLANQALGQGVRALEQECQTLRAGVLSLQKDREQLLQTLELERKGTEQVRSRLNFLKRAFPLNGLILRLRRWWSGS